MSSLGLVSCGTVHTETWIDASPEKVWNVIADAKLQHEWHPVIQPYDGEYKEGTKIKLNLLEPGEEPLQVTAKVKKSEPNEELNIAGGFWAFISFDHYWYLKPGKGGTRVIQHEEFKGIYLLFWDYSLLESYYQKANTGLKERVASMEKINNSSRF